MSKQGRELPAIRTAEYLRGLEAVRVRRWERLARHLERERLGVATPTKRATDRARRAERQAQAMERAS